MEFLSENGIETLVAGSIKEAMSIYKGNSSEIDLFLIDLKLPDGNGIDFLKVVRKESNTIPAIIMSIIITEDVRKIGNQLGVVAYFEKPFDLNELKRVINLNP